MANGKDHPDSSFSFVMTLQCPHSLGGTTCPIPWQRAQLSDFLKPTGSLQLWFTWELEKVTMPFCLLSLISSIARTFAWAKLMMRERPIEQT